MGENDPQHRRWHAVMRSEVRREGADAVAATLGGALLLGMAALSAFGNSPRLAAVMFGLSLLILLLAWRQALYWRKLRAAARGRPGLPLPTQLQ